MAVRSSSEGILVRRERRQAREELIEMLKKAYWMEIETVMSYISNSINPDGVRAQEIVESLQEDIQEELGHAQQFANRIKELYGVVPGSQEFTAEQSYLQPPEHQTDIVHVIRGVIEAETGAIEHYNRIIEFTDGHRLGDQGHGDRDPPRRGGPPPPVRGLPARVQRLARALALGRTVDSRRVGVESASGRARRAAVLEPVLDLLPTPLLLVEPGTGGTLYANPPASGSPAAGCWPRGRRRRGVFGPDGRRLARDEHPACASRAASAVRHCRSTGARRPGRAR